jgi:GTP-sensing pleiotropic transcriptional regulator CodY
MRIGNDERLKAIFESLTVECRLTPRNIARLTGVDVDVIENVLREPRTISIEKKYELAIKGSYLINAANQARGQYESTTHR